MMDREKFELTELGLNIRHWENLRWVSMTVFIAVMGALAAATIGAGGIQIPKIFVPITKLAGVLFTLIFWIQDERIVAYWKNSRNRALVVEQTLGVQIFSTAPKRGILSAGTAVRLLYACFGASWLLLIML